MEAMQFQSGSRVHIVDRELRATAAIEQHQRAQFFWDKRSVLLREISRLHRHVLMLHAHRCISVISLLPKLSDIGAAEHVAIHKESPAW